jgi:hypothetical protein
MNITLRVVHGEVRPVVSTRARCGCRSLCAEGKATGCLYWTEDGVVTVVVLGNARQKWC